jgi:hypothetical protein
MLVTAKTRRDPFTFSLTGMAGIKACTFVPAIPDDKINRAIDLKYRRQSNAGKLTLPLVLRIEDVLARFYAPGC